MVKTFYSFQDENIPPSSQDLESSINIEFNDYLE
jgi:hypothetical protein